MTWHNIKQRIFYWWQYRFPLVSRKRMEQDIRVAHLKAEAKAQADVRQQLELFDSLLPKMMRIDLTREDRFNTYRLSVAFTDLMVHEMFSHGNDQEAIRFLARRMSAQIERELATINFARIPMVKQ